MKDRVRQQDSFSRMLLDSNGLSGPDFLSSPSMDLLFGNGNEPRCSDNSLDEAGTHVAVQ